MPLRLPTKPKKGKSKQLNIDYTSLDSARSSAPGDWDDENWLQEGTRQEEQSERYLAGPKAQRHAQNALTCYRLSASLSPSSFDARYNAARVFQSLATEHLSSPTCLEALETAIGGYREALAVLNEGENGTARIDALFNLAQADAALYEMLDEGVSAVERETERALQAAKEAKDCFVEVEKLQRVAMEAFFGAGGPQNGNEEADESFDAAGLDTGGQTMEVEAVETTIVTPHLIVDTLLESIALDVALSSSISDPNEQAALQHSAVNSLSRANTLRALIPRSSSGPDELDLDLALAQASILATFSPASHEATSFLQSFLSSFPSPRVELLSAYADQLLESLDLSQPFDSLLVSLKNILAIYEQSAALLSDRLSPPKHTPAAHIPSFLSANLVSQGNSHLLAYTLASRFPSSSSLPPAQLAEHLSQAHTLSLCAITAAKSGLSLAISNTFTPSPSSPLARPPLAFVRAPASTDPRTNWRTLSAVRSALFTLVRVRLRLSPPDGAEENEEKERKTVWALWRALGLAVGRAGGEGEERERQLKRREVRWWIEESGEDKVSEAMSEEDRARERGWWERLAEM
ncbi:hypothetical protein JCM8547_008791 [Rhodosporidiobolus lusitaniae]